MLTPGFTERIESEIRMMTPSESPVDVKIAQDPLHDAWKGGAFWVDEMIKTNQFIALTISRATYEESGHGYLIDHPLSNVYIPTSFVS